MIIKKCLKCGILIKVFDDCECSDCGIKCCNDQMKILVPNESEASFEKHIPEYEINGKKIIVRVNHVMEDEHYIEWISYVYNNNEHVVYFNPGDKINVEFEYFSGGILYAYCNKHLLWTRVVE